MTHPRTTSFHKATLQEGQDRNGNPNGCELRPGAMTSTPHDELKEPNGVRYLSELQNSEAVNLFIAAGVPGVSHSQGRSTNFAAYAAWLLTQ